MKKLFAAALPCVCALLFFSCQTTGGTASKAEQDALSGLKESPEQVEETQSESAAEEPAQDTSAQDTSAARDDSAAALEEKIPQDEVDADLAESQDQAAVTETEAEQAQEAEQESASKISRNDDGSLLEKIKGGQNDSGERAQDTSVSVPPASSDTNEITRVTNQGNSVKGGPLIGPGSDTANGQKPSQDRDSTNMSSSANSGAANSGAAAASSSAKSGAETSSALEPNEAIALSTPNKAQDEEAAPAEEKLIPVPSRSMSVKNNQFLDVTYPGSGWIYLGEEDGGDHFIFQGRKLGNGETTFTLRSKKPGTALLHFYKNDILTGNYIDDWIQVTVGEKSAADATHVKAPAYADVVPPKFDREKNKAQTEKAVAEAAAKKQAERQEKIEKPEAKTDSPAQGQKAAQPQEQSQGAAAAKTESPSEKVQTVIQTSGQAAGQEKPESKQKTAVAGTTPGGSGDKGASQAQGSSSDKTAASTSAQSGGSAQDLLSRARKAYDEKRFEEALDLVQKFFDAATEDFDAGLYLEGLILEAKSSVRNIKSAIGAYDTLIKNWPQSPYWRKANERAIYLKRFYIDIR